MFVGGSLESESLVILSIVALEYLVPGNQVGKVSACQTEQRIAVSFLDLIIVCIRSIFPKCAVHDIE